ncbi:uncharacterized protein LOC141905739 [Tubulanus polymorphus]|uniref:uncharacterized protein LOC141905739 n=1 Tax=Tubulanus polymorphus TaxID=672921 RepID=UPI003DA6421B
MAAGMLVRQGYSFLRSLSAQTVSVRYRAKITPGKYDVHKRKQKNYFQIETAKLENLEAWAGPILERQRLKKQQQETETKQPHKLHAVCRIKKLKGRPWYEKNMMQHLGLSEEKRRTGEFIILKNTKLTNDRLLKVNHLIKVLPVTFPHGIPENEDDLKHCMIKPNGEFIFVKKLDDVTVTTEPEESEEEKKWLMDGETIKKHCTRKKELMQINEEFFPAHYTYRFNQDGTEYRYNVQKHRQFTSNNHNTPVGHD